MNDLHCGSSTSLNNVRIVHTMLYKSQFKFIRHVLLFTISLKNPAVLIEQFNVFSRCVHTEWFGFNL